MGYNNLDEVEYDLKRLNLERQIALEELKGIKYELREDLSPYNWIASSISTIKKFGLWYFIRKIIK